MNVGAPVAHLSGATRQTTLRGASDLNWHIAECEAVFGVR